MQVLQKIIRAKKSDMNTLNTLNDDLLIKICSCFRNYNDINSLCTTCKHCFRSSTRCIAELHCAFEKKENLDISDIFTKLQNLTKIIRCTYVRCKYYD